MEMGGVIALPPPVEEGAPPLPPPLPASFFFLAGMMIYLLLGRFGKFAQYASCKKRNLRSVRRAIPGDVATFGFAPALRCYTMLNEASARPPPRLLPSNYV
mmetsp:Transcript_25485/g.73709  ORF Transcript_25485/g.73709 Transcript_25485/m.73709 type:complete len:101 (+) Transcript_25485:130-432(+)